MQKDSRTQLAVEIAKQEVEHWEEEVRSAQVRLEEERERLEQAVAHLRTAREFLTLVHHRFGVQIISEPTSVYAGMRLLDAALSVIERKGQATMQEIIDELEAGGFQFGKYPRRQLHFALIHAERKATRDDRGTWHWTVRE